MGTLTPHTRNLSPPKKLRHGKPILKNIISNLLLIHFGCFLMKTCGKMTSKITPSHIGHLLSVLCNRNILYKDF